MQNIIKVVDYDWDNFLVKTVIRENNVYYIKWMKMSECYWYMWS